MTKILLSFNKNQEESSGSNAESESANRGTFRGRRSNGRGRSSGRGPSVFTDKCFTCNQVGHHSFRCPEKEQTRILRLFGFVPS